MPPAVVDASEVLVRRRLRVRAPAAVVWDTARAVSTQHIAGFSFAAVELPTVGAPQFLLVRPSSSGQCRVDLYEVRRPSAWRQDLVAASRPKPSDDVVVTTAARRLPYPPAHLWDRLVAQDRPATGTFVMRVLLTPGPLQVGSIVAQVAAAGDRLWPFLHQVTEQTEGQCLVLRRVNGSTPGRVEWRLTEVSDGTSVTLTHRGPTAPQSLEETLDALQDLARLPISTGESTR